VKQVGRATADLVTRGKDPDPESVWNRERTWKRISDNPPSYIPYNYTGALEGTGEWITDQRDGKRLFVPSGGVEGFPESVLRAEAAKATMKRVSSSASRES
jgi:hypothetical protein